jgi:fructokinase
MKSSLTVVGLGEILWDLYPDEKYLGGAPANAAIHVCRLGYQGVVVSSVGQDDLGNEILLELERQQIPVEYIQKSAEKPTGTVHVRLDKKGIPRFQCSKDTAFDDLLWVEKYKSIADSCDAVIVGTLAQRNKTSREFIQSFLKRTNGLIVYDVNFREWNDMTSVVVQETLNKAHVCKLNENELDQIREASGHEDKDIPSFLQLLVKGYNLKFAALSLGEKGCLLTSGLDQTYIPGYNANVVDTTGCGDAFDAALTVKYLENVSIQEMGDYANLVGAFVATRRGATPKYTPGDLSIFQKTHQKNKAL